jgi:hypothetical protein
MTVLRVAIAGFVILLSTLSTESCTNTDNASRAGGIDSSIAASEAMMLSFRDSVRGVSQEEKDRRTRDALAVHASDSLDACSTPFPAAAVTRHTNDLFTLELPSDFRLTLDGEDERKKRGYGYARYQWTGEDGSIVYIEPANRSESHSGWTGAISSECDLEIGPHKAHLDVANASLYVEDRIVHAMFDLSPRLSLSLLVHAKSRQRQSELLSAIHTVRVRSGWGATN